MRPISQKILVVGILGKDQETSEQNCTDEENKRRYSRTNERIIDDYHSALLAAARGR